MHLAVTEQTAGAQPEHHDHQHGRHQAGRAGADQWVQIAAGKALAETDRQRAEEAMAVVRANATTTEQLGDTFWLGRRMERYSSVQLLMLLGFEFDQALRRLPVGEWHGPVK
ncbi:MAG: hypothetical protein KDK91_32805, partial [Gammaproteobacteria bacterium]|nr:hypothetical protein [Gammaproteobacteria bacterium]